MDDYFLQVVRDAVIAALVDLVGIMRNTAEVEAAVGDDAETTAWSAATADDLDLDWLLGERAVGLDVGARTVELRDGEWVPSGWGSCHPTVTTGPYDFTEILKQNNVEAGK